MAINKEYNDVQLDVKFTQASTRANLVSEENISVSFGKLAKWHEALVPTDGSSGKILAWNTAGTAKWSDPLHPTITKSTDTTSAASPAHGGTFTTVDSVTRDAYGHVTKINTKTITLPADSNTDTKVTQTNTTTSADYRVLLSGNANDTTETTTGRKSANLKFNPSSGGLYSFGFLWTDITGLTLDINTLTLSNGTLHSRRFIEKTDGGATNITNIPVTGHPFLLEVDLIRWASTTDYITRQRFTNAANGAYSYVRYCTNGTWGSWTTRKYTDTNTKVTSSANHYTPATVSGEDKSASASGATAAWSIDVVKGVTLNTDGKGHVTGLSVTSGKIPTNPIPSNNVTGNTAWTAADRILVTNAASGNVIKQSAYTIGATLNSGTTNQLAYYSGANAISATHDGTNTGDSLYFKTGTNAKSSQQIILGIYGQTYGNDAATLISGTAGVFSYGDGGPQIDFNSSVSGSQAGALIFTDHDSAATGASWHFVSNQADWNVTSKRFHARTSISIGTDLPQKSYNLYVNGTSQFNGTTTISTSAFGTQLVVERSGSSNHASLGFKNNLGVLGYIAALAVDDDLYHIYASDTSKQYIILDTGNTSVTTSGSGNAITALSFSNGTFTATKGSTFSLSTHTHSNYLGAKSDGTYYGMASPTGVDNVWIRTTSQGIIPYQEGRAGSGHNYLGTSTWYFAHAYIDTVHGSLDGTATYANELNMKTLTADTLDTTPGSYVFKGDYLLGSTFDWVGLQVDASNDRFQIIANGQLMFRQNDNTAITDSWKSWLGCLTPANVAGSSGITVTQNDITIGSGDAAFKYKGSVTISHSNSITASTSTVFKKFSYDANGHITGTANVTASDLPSHTHGLLHSDLNQAATNGTTGGWSVIGIDPAVNGYVLKSIRVNSTSPNWLSGGYGAGIAFGGADTKGVISMRWDSSVITFAGGNHNSTITSPTWYFKISGTSGSTYNLANFYDTTTSRTANTVLAAPNGSAGAATFRKLVAADLPDSYLPTSGGTVSGTLVLSKTQDASGTANNSPALIVGGAATSTHLELDANEIMAKTNGTSTAALYINNDGGNVYINNNLAARHTATPTSGQVVITDGTSGGIKSSGSTIVTTPSGKVNTNWGTTSDRTTIVTKGWMSYWDGSYDGSASNLTYCNKGAFGTIVTKNTGDYVPINGKAPNGIGRDGYVAYATDGFLNTGDGTVTGALVITTPFTKTKGGVMLKFTVDIYNYKSNTSVEYKISGYVYNDGRWYNCTAYCVSSGVYSADIIDNLTVRFGYVTDGFYKVQIGETTTNKWQYPRINIHDITVAFTHSSYTDANSGWSVEFVTSGNIPNITQTITNTAQQITPISVTSSTLDTTPGTFAFFGSGAPWTGSDWCGLQVGFQDDRFQIVASNGTLSVRQNDSHGTPETAGWTAWKTLSTTDHTHSYIPMSGSTGVTGNIEITKASGDTGFYAKRSDTGVEVLMGVGSGGTNHGIYSNKLGKWMMYGDATNVYLNGNAATATTATKVATTVTNGTTSTVRYGVAFVADPNTSNAQAILKNYDFRFNLLNGTDASGNTGNAEVVLGNNKSSGTAGNKKGVLTLYSTGSYYGGLDTGTLTANRTYTLPNASGNVALLTKGSTSFWGLIDGDGSVANWIRATSNGFIPSASAQFFQAATSSLGTNTWYFKNSYIQYMNANSLVLGAAKTADGAAKGQLKFFSGNRSDATGTVTLECINDAVRTGDYTVKLPTCNGTIPVFEKLFQGASNTVSLSYSDIEEYDLFLITVANSNASAEPVTVTSLWISNVAGVHDMPLIWGGAPSSSGGACNVTSGWIQLSKNSGTTTFVVAHKPSVAQMTSSGWTISSPTYNLYIRKIFGLKTYKRV